MQTVDGAQRPFIAGADEAVVTALLQGAQQLHGEERVAFGVEREVGDEPVAVIVRQRVVHACQCREVVDAKSPEVEPEPLGLADKRRQPLVEGVLPGELVLAVGRQQEEWQVVDARGDMPKQLEAGRVGPVDILQHDHRRVSGGDGAQERRHIGEEGGLAGDGIERPVRQHVGQRREIGGVGKVAVAVGEVEPEAVRRRGGHVVAVSDRDDAALRTRLAGEIPREGGLADAGFPAKDDEVAAARLRRTKLLAEQDTLRRPSDDRRR